MRGTTSLKRTLITDYMLVIILLGASILAATVIVARGTVLTLSGTLIEQAVERTRKEMHTFFRPVSKSLLALASLARNGDLGLDRPAGVRRTFSSLMVQFPQVTSMLYADEHGHEVMVLRDGAGWRSRETRPEIWGNQSRWLEWATGARAHSSEKELDYDARSRPWFREALERRGRAADREAEEAALGWTSPYRFFTTGDPGLTASVAFADKRGNIQVLAADVMLSDLSAFTRGLKLLNSGVVTVLTEDGRIIGLPGHPAFATPVAAAGAFLAEPGALDWSLAESSDAIYRQRNTRHPVRIDEGEAVWWGYAHPFQLDPASRLWIVALVPESDMLGNVAHLRLIIILVTAMALGLAGWRVMVLARRYSEPMEALVVQSERFSRGDLAQRPIEPGRIREIATLAQAHEDMRQGLLALMKLERDLQLARQIQQSTLPGELPVLVGFDLDAWSEPAEETGGDTYDVVSVRPGAAGGGESDRVMLLLADATGHGIGPALSATQVRAMFRMAVRAGESVTGMARHLNEQLYEDLHDGRFVCTWLGVLDTGTARLTSFSAGQGGAFHYCAATGVCRRLEAEAPPMGILDDLPGAEPAVIELGRGDLFAVFSDGIYEAEDATGALFGIDRVTAHLASHARHDAGAVNRTLMTALKRHVGKRGMGDDCTGIVIKRR